MVELSIVNQVVAEERAILRLLISFRSSDEIAIVTVTLSSSTTRSPPLSMYLSALLMTWAAFCSVRPAYMTVIASTVSGKVSISTPVFMSRVKLERMGRVVSL